MKKTTKTPAKKRAAKKRKGSSEHEQTAQKRRQAAFLEAYITCGTITHAARMAKIARLTHYTWLAGGKEYQKAFAEAEIAATDALVQEARRRAIQGVSEPILYKGKVVKTIQKYSDHLLMFLIKGALPEVYRERYEFSGGPKPIQFIGYDQEKLKGLSDEELQVLRSLAAKVASVTVH